MNHHGDQGPARPALLPDRTDAGQADADVEWAQYVAWADREAAAGARRQGRFVLHDPRPAAAPQPERPSPAGTTR